MNIKCKLAFLSIILLSAPAVEAKRPAPLVITAEEAVQHHLPALGFQMPANTGVASLNKFPKEGVYIQNQPTPPGGAYLFTVVAYNNLPAGRDGLLISTAKFSTVKPASALHL